MSSVGESHDEGGFNPRRRKLLEASLTVIGIFFSIFQIKKLNRTKQFFWLFFVFFDWDLWTGLGVGLGETNTGSGS